MSVSVLKRSVKIFAVLAFLVAATPTQKARAGTCSGNPFFFCECARAAVQQCWSDYEACGGFFVDGCWDTYSQCELDSGIDQCQ
jgi:hypothetical protein